MDARALHFLASPWPPPPRLFLHKYAFAARAGTSRSMPSTLRHDLPRLQTLSLEYVHAASLLTRVHPVSQLVRPSINQSVTSLFVFGLFHLLPLLPCQHAVWERPISHLVLLCAPTPGACALSSSLTMPVACPPSPRLFAVPQFHLVLCACALPPSPLHLLLDQPQPFARLGQQGVNRRAAPPPAAALA
jgi:hypothetical protein